MIHLPVLVTLAAVVGSEAPETGTCARLAQLGIPEARVTSAAEVAAGSFSPPAALTPWLRGDPATYKSLPAFCRVVVLAAPSADSGIEIEVWMPVEGWNGKLRGQGNGGFAGEINFRALARAVAQGYATAGTNTGHSAAGTDASWALGHPEKVTDFGYRAIHVMTDVAKAVTKTYYGRDVQRSYFAACSNGGRQALMEVQRFPGDYDGVLAGAPANNWTHMLAKSIADAKATTLDPASYIPAGKLPAIAEAVNAACDSRDGLTDGIVDDPSSCRFDPSSILCKDGDSAACLTAPQAKALRALYEGPRDAKGERIFPGYVPGAEEGQGGWGPWITGSSPGKSLIFTFGIGYFANMVFEKADWDYHTADVPQLLAAAQEKTARALDATDPEIRAFKDRGGKLIVYHGWNDPAISALNTVGYYGSVVSRLGEAETDAFLRLYMVPGMQHCSGGPGPDAFGQDGNGPRDDPRRNVFLALEQWVEAGTAPGALVASRRKGDDAAQPAEATRLVCPHPQVAKYSGKGGPSDAASFACVPPGP
jgi:Tannase and feruloyl esterase